MKRLLPIILAVLLLLAGCGKVKLAPLPVVEKDGSYSAASPAPTSTFAPTPEPTPNPTSEPTPEPTATPTPEFHVIYDSQMQILQEQIKNQIDSLWGEWAVYVEDLETGAGFEVREGFKSDRDIPPASTVKLFIVAAYLYEIENGSAPDDYDTELNLKYAITRSDNNCSDWLSGRIGFDRINEICRELVFNDTEVTHKFTVDSELKNYTSIKDISRLLRMCYKGELISPEASERLMNYLLNQEINTKMSLVLPGDAKLAHKTGEYYSSANHDVGIIYMPEGKHDFIMCCFSAGLGDESARYAIAEMAKDAYDYFAAN